MKILSVDDVLLIRKLTKKTVEAMGGQLFEASDGIEALSTLKKTEGKFDLIILDWNMPNMNGFEFLNKIRRQEKYKNIPVMMATTEGEKDKIVKAVQAGANNYLIKPFTEQELTKKILQCLGLGYEYDLLNNCFSDAARNILAYSTGLEVSEEYGPPETAAQKDYLSGQMIIQGKVNAIIYLTMGREAATGIISLMTGLKPPELTSEDILNGTADIIQKVAAKAKNLLTGMNVQWSISTPFVYVSFITEDLHIQQKKVFSIVKKYRADDLVVNYKIYFL